MSTTSDNEPKKTAQQMLAEHIEKLRPRREVPAPDSRPRWQGKLVAPVTKQI